MSQADTITLSQINDELEAISKALSEAQMIARVVTEHTESMGLEGSSRMLSAVDRIIGVAGKDLHATICKVAAVHASR